MQHERFGLSDEEYRTLEGLRTPQKVQDFLNSLPINYEKHRETCMSPKRVLATGKAHCMEGALLAALAFRIQGQKPLLLDLKTGRGDVDHVVALYKVNGYWGAVSKTNHAVLRYRDPVYKTIRELALSYFHEYFLNSNGRKTLRSYSAPFSLVPYGTDWISSREDLWYLPEALDVAKHFPIAPAKNIALLRIADPIERSAGGLTEWKRTDTGT